MRGALVVAFRRGAARLVLGAGLIGVIWTALYKTWPWHLSRGPMLERQYVHLLPTGSPWDLPVAAIALALGIAFSMLIYRRRSAAR